MQRERIFKRVAPKGYVYDLERIVDVIFEAAYKRDWSWRDLARFSGLCYQTVWLIGERRTRFPQFTTVWKLAKAVQLRLEFSTTRASIVKDKRQKTA